MSTDVRVIFGPPGTGKTTELSRLVRQCVEAEGSDTVCLTAFTRAAAREMAGRDLGIHARQVGTLHSLCFHALDSPPIAETQTEDWNTLHPNYQITATDASDPSVGKTPGDLALAGVNLLRHRLVPPGAWAEHLRHFWHEWCSWKGATGSLDFTDLLEQALRLVPIAPGRPRTLIVDEAQDLSLLQWQLLRQWANHADRWIVAGDDDQALYRWAGADYQPMLDAQDRSVLPQSYRVPQAIQAEAARYTALMPGREPKEWRPRQALGSCERAAGRWEAPEAWVGRINDWIAEPFGTYAILAPCGYMLGPLIAALRGNGIPFGNRWRRRDRGWNPLAPPTRGVSTVQRLLDYLRPPDRLWGWGELARWLPLVRAEGVLVRGGKAHVALHDEERGVCTLADMQALFRPDALDGALNGGVEWLGAHVLQSHARALAYPLRVLSRHGRRALTDEPRVTVGTAHSMKGGEADNVLFFDALSSAQAHAVWRGGAEAGDIARLRYVALTRARENLVIVGSRPL